MTITTVSKNRCFGGVQGTYSHESTETGCTMRVGVFLPPQAPAQRVPVLYWLSGLTCTEENFIVKAGAQRVAAELGIALVVPDTSPRGLAIPAEGANYDFGLGAGFYVDATEAPWSRGYRMYSYVVRELREVVAAGFPVDPSRAGIFGHSMGGHGALTIALRNPRSYRSVSAFAPICSPMRCPWGEKALAGYLGEDRARWREYDATALLEDRGWSGPPLFVDQGTQDQFLETQLKPDLLRAACAERNVPLELRMQDGYDHSYFFISSFIEDHLRFHARHLQTRTRQPMIDTRQDRWLPGPARLKAMPLHEFTGERVALMKWLPGEQSQSHRHRGGEEIDPVLLAMSPQAFTLTGSECIEGVEGVDFAQSWLVRDA